MDSLPAIGFYVSAALAGVGGLGLAFTRHHERRGLALGLVGLGVAGAYASLSAGFSAVIPVPLFAGRWLLVPRPPFPPGAQAGGPAWGQRGGRARPRPFP